MSAARRQAARELDRRRGGDAAQLPSTLHPVLRRIYAARGVAAAAELDLSLARLPPIGRLGGLEAAVDLLLAHRGARVLVIGDFDADGATASALVLRCLGDYGFGDVGYLVPNRFDYGYGLTPELAEVAAREKPDLLVTVDNGISSVAGIARARELGMPVIVTDHHLPGDELPAAAIVNPNLPGDPFPGKALAGVGVAFCLMAALGRRLEAEGNAGAARAAARYLDLVALGTVADVVPLDHANRILVHQGLARIRAGAARPGVLALLTVAGRDPADAVAADLAFAAAPRLNAAGRLEDMSLGIEALLTDSPAVAREHAERLSSLNRERREIESRMQAEALASVDAVLARQTAHTPPDCLALYDASWHQGVVGLVAARVRERIGRPVIAFARAAEGELKGSGRSVPGVHLRDLLEAVAARRPRLITRFGGHAMAAGLTLPEPAFDEFRAAVAEELRRRFPAAEFDGPLLTDGPLDPDCLGLDFAEQLRAAGPWGQGFPEPLFEGRFRVLDQRIVGERHLKLRLAPPAAERPVDAIAFGQAETPGVTPGADLELAYRLDVNDYAGLRRPQLVIEQLRPIPAEKPPHTAAQASTARD